MEVMQVDFLFTFHQPSLPELPPPPEAMVALAGSGPHERFIVHHGSPLVRAAITLKCELDNPTRRVPYDGTVHLFRQDGGRENWVVHFAAGMNPVHPERFLLEVGLSKTYNNAIRATFRYSGQFNSAAAGHEEAWEQVRPGLEESDPGLPDDEVIRARETSKVLMWLLMEVVGNLGGSVGDTSTGISWIRMIAFLYG